jgi:molybdopterin-guanine dinucleotide biosynthesis protein A
MAAQSGARLIISHQVAGVVLKDSQMMGAIQAGGLSSRMGQDKAWLTIDGRALIEYSLAAIQQVVESVAVVANPLNSDYRDLAGEWQALLLEDRIPGCGPLGGIEAALRAAKEDVLALGCDFPFVTSDLLRRLRSIHETEMAEATVPIDAGGRLQPLVAVYGAACLSHIETMLDSGEYKVDRLFTRILTRFVRFGEFAALPGSHQFFTNINTPADYRAARER